MKKATVLMVALLFLSAVLSELLVAEEKSNKRATFVAITKGSILDVFPNIKINNTWFLSNAGTTGISANIPDGVLKMEESLMRNLKYSTQKTCEDNGLPISGIDLIDVQIAMVGDTQINSLVYVSGRGFCASN